MRLLHPTEAIVLALSIMAPALASRTPAVFAPLVGDYATADIRVLTPGVVFSSGLPDLGAAFSEVTGYMVGINTVGMGTIVERFE